MGIETQAYNLIPPYRNSTGLASQAAVVVNQAGVNINLSDYFGGLGFGHFITFQADGAKVYIQVDWNTVGAAPNEQEQGGGVGVMWPIPDGQQLPMRVIGGRITGTGYSTMVTYASGIIVRAKLALSGAATGFLRMYKSSLDETQGIGQLRPVGWPNPIPL
jgi:hypothetical protein